MKKIIIIKKKRKLRILQVYTIQQIQQNKTGTLAGELRVTNLTLACGCVRITAQQTKKLESVVPFLCYFWQMGYNNLCLLMQINPSYYQLAFPRKSFDLKSETSTEGDQNENIYEHLSHPHATSSHFSSKAKTSLCKNYTSKGVCPYGKKCQFAHGPQQLRINMEHNRSYKTKVCHAFQKEGFCCFGERCNFIHNQCKSKEGPQQRWREIYLNHRQTINPPQFTQTSRLLSLLH